MFGVSIVIGDASEEGLSPSCTVVGWLRVICPNRGPNLEQDAERLKDSVGARMLPTID